MDIKTAKKFAPYIIALVAFVIAVILLRALRPRELKPTYQINFKELYSSSQTLEIAGFREGENWKGNYTFDSIRTFDDEVGMNVFSSHHIPQIISLTKNMNLEDYDSIYGYVFLPQRDYTKQIERLAITFKSLDDETSYEIGSLGTGWNLVTMHRADFSNKSFDWKKISTTSIQLVSRNGSTVQVAFDRLWAQKPLKNSSEFISYQKNYLNSKTINKETYLHLASPHVESVLFNKMVQNNYSYTVAIAPLKFQTFGLIFQADKKNKDGYYFDIEGLEINKWRLVKIKEGKKEELGQGKLKNNMFEKEAYLWLKVERSGNNIVLSVSYNNQQFSPIIQLKDSAFPKGHVGISYKGSYLVDSIVVKE